MINFFMGQLSPSHSFAQNFACFLASDTSGLAGALLKNLRFALLTVGLMLGLLSGLQASPDPSPASLSELTSTWKVNVEMDCPLEGGSFWHVALFEDLSGFEGFRDDLSVMGNKLIYTLSGPASALPADTEVAVITVMNPDCGGERQWMVRVDGSGTILLVDEF